VSAAGFAPDLDSNPPRLSDNAVQKISELGHIECTGNTWPGLGRGGSSEGGRQQERAGLSCKGCRLGLLDEFPAARARNLRQISRVQGEQRLHWITDVTLLVGVLCSNGAVIAADRQATHGAMGQQTVGQSVTKVQVINGEALYATSGHKGLGQQLCAIVDGKQPEFKNQRYDANIVKLQDALRPVVNGALRAQAG
jgi:hypothetical protein